MFTLYTLYLQKTNKMVSKPINPFINTTIVPFIEVIKSMSGYGANMEVDKYEIEADTYARVYTCKANRDFIYNHLSIYARDMLMAIIYSTNTDYEYVILTYEKILELHGTYSKRRFDDTVKELVKYNIIDCKDKSKGKYWINPIFFAAGNRLTMYPACKVKVRTNYK